MAKKSQALQKVPVASEEVSSEDEELVCRRLRALRIESGLTLDALAARSGFTKGYLSRIETGGKAPPIASLARIARALGQSLSYFFLDDVTSAATRADDARVSVVHKWERKPVSRGATAFGYDYVSLAHKRATKLMDPFVFTFPASVDADQYFQHAGEEFIYVLSGHVAFEVVLNDVKHTYKLEAGDSIYFDSDLPHRGHSVDGEAQAMVVMQGAADDE
jgi:transcriptional regulator with XRE-family HTH domain